MKRNELFLATGLMATALLLGACAAETTGNNTTQTTTASTQAMTTEASGTMEQGATMENGQKLPILTVTSVPLDDTEQVFDVPSEEIPTQEFVIQPDGKLQKK